MGYTVLAMNLLTYPPRLFFKQLPIVVPFGLSVLANVITWGWLAWFFKPTNEPVFLHYNVLFGVDYIGDWHRVFLLPIVGVSILLINTLLGWLLASRDMVVAYILQIISLLSSSLLLLMALLLVEINT